MKEAKNFIDNTPLKNITMWSKSATCITFYMKGGRKIIFEFV